MAFYGPAGYQSADQLNGNTLLWKSFSPDAKPPRFMRPVEPLPVGREKVNVAVFMSGYCSYGIYCCVLARDAAHELEEMVEYNEVDTSENRSAHAFGLSDGIYIDGRRYQIDGPLFSVDKMKVEIKKAYYLKHDLPIQGVAGDFSV